MLASHALEVRHSTFDRDIDAVIRGLEKQGIRPPARTPGNASKPRLPRPVATVAGGPDSDADADGYLALAALLVVGSTAVASWWAYRTAYDSGLTAGDKQARDAVAKSVDEVTHNNEQQFRDDFRNSLRIWGVVTDGGVGVEGANVRLTNRTNDLQVSDTTDSRGVYNIDLGKIEIAQGDVVRVEVTKPPYKTTSKT